MPFVRFRVDLAPNCSLGPGKISLLEAIEEKGSLTQAAASLGMSYRYAWLLVGDMNASFKEPVTQATVGGVAGGGASLTPFGSEIVRCYRAAQRRMEALAREDLAPIAKKALSRTDAKAMDASVRRRSVKRSAKVARKGKSAGSA